MWAPSGSKDVSQYVCSVRPSKNVSDLIFKPLIHVPCSRGKDFVCKRCQGLEDSSAYVIKTMSLILLAERLPRKRFNGLLVGWWLSLERWRSWLNIASVLAISGQFPCLIQQDKCRGKYGSQSLAPSVATFEVQAIALKALHDWKSSLCDFNFESNYTTPWH